MVFLGTIEVLQRHDLNTEGQAILLGLLCHGQIDEGEVIGVDIIDTGTVAGTLVFALLVEAGGVDGFEVHLQKEGEADLEGVVLQMDGLGIAGGVGVDLLVGGVGGVAIGKTHLGESYAVDLLEEMLGAPKAAGSKIKVFDHNLVFCMFELWEFRFIKILKQLRI